MEKWCFSVFKTTQFIKINVGYVYFKIQITSYNVKNLKVFRKTGRRNSNVNYL